MIQVKPFTTSQGIITLYERPSDGMTYQAAHAEAGMSPAHMSGFGSNNTPSPFLHLPDHYIKYAKDHSLATSGPSPPMVAVVPPLGGAVVVVAAAAVVLKRHK